MGVSTTANATVGQFADIEGDDIGPILREMIKDDPSIRLKILALLDDATIQLL